MTTIMKGFEIIVNHEDPIKAATEKALVCTFTMDYRNGSNLLHVIGGDSEMYHAIWADRKLKIGDKVKIRITEIERTSRPIKRNPSDRDALKERYEQLKKELQEKGVIK